ncbi:hypothetical protein [Blastococcus sp. SYSU DS0619]
MASIRSPLGRIATGALTGFLLGFAVGLLVAVVFDGEVNPFFFGAIGIAVGAGIAGDRPRGNDDRSGTSP